MNSVLKTCMIAATTLLAGVAAVANPAETEADRWNLKDMYKTQTDWDQDASKLEAQLKEFSACSGKLASSVKVFKHCMDLNSNLQKRYALLASYAFQWRDEDTGATAGLDLSQRADVLGNHLQEASSFASPELLKMGRAKVMGFLKKDKSLAIYRQPLDNILRSAEHTLDKRGEALIASFGSATNAAEAVYGTLSNADMPWPKVKLSDGSEVVIDQSAYTKYRSLGNREDRKKVFDAFWGKWKEFERTYGVNFYEYLKKSTVYSKVRNYPDSLSQALDGNKLPAAVYNTLVEQANANLPTLHRYFRLRAKMLGVSEMRYYDIYPPLVKSTRVYSITDATALMLASAKPLGDDYVKAMTQATKSRWMDVYPRPRKASGAYMNGSAYDVHPYLLLNHNDDYESVSTLAPGSCGLLVSLAVGEPGLPR